MTARLLIRGHLLQKRHLTDLGPNCLQIAVLGHLRHRHKVSYAGRIRAVPSWAMD